MEKKKDSGDNVLLLGIDLGTSRTSVMSNKGFKTIVRSVVGYPRDLIGAKLFGATCVFGEDALQKSSALSLYYPLQDGSLRETHVKERKAAFDLLEHVVGLAKQSGKTEACGIIGVPARASIMNKEILLDIAGEVLETALVVSQPFMVAYGLNNLHNSIVIDIGAGTVDICGMKGTVPAAEDQVTILKGGDYLDERLGAVISQEHPEVQLTRHLVRHIKESHAFVGKVGGPVRVMLRTDGKPQQYDLTEEIRTVCESIVPDIVEQLTAIVRGFDPENQPQALLNIFLAGGGSRIRGLAAMIAEEMKDYGETRVTCVDDPDFAGSAGALKLTADLPRKYWSRIGFVSKKKEGAGVLADYRQASANEEKEAENG